MRIDEIMSRGVFSLPPTATVADALELVMSRNILHVLVLDAGRVVGTISIRELSGRSRELPLTAVMNRDFRTASPSATLKEAAQLMLGRSSGCVPIVEGGRVVGIITSSDLMRVVTRPERLAHGTV